MRAFLALCISAVLASCAPAFADWAIEDMNFHIDQTNFVVNKGCSGTLIDAKERYVLTAAHCVASQYETFERETIDDDGTIKTENVRRMIPGTVTQLSFDEALEVRQAVYRTKLVAVDKAKDLAVLQVMYTHLRPSVDGIRVARRACDAPVRGEEVFLVGNPMGNLYSSVSRGIVSSVQRSYGLIRFGDSGAYDEPLMQVSAGVIGGNSGGAIYNDEGEMIGVPVVANQVNEVVAFAVPLDTIKAFLKAKKLEALYAHCEPPVELDAE